VEVKNGPTNRGGHISFVHQDKLYIFGGFAGKGGFTYLYDMMAATIGTFI
jgi:hypothetical protein